MSAGLRTQESTDDRVDSVSNRPVLLVFSDDWGRHPSSCQHLIRHLLDEYSVIWVNTIGMRPPKFNWSTFQRGCEKVGHWLGPRGTSEPLPANLKVIKPFMWPWIRGRFDRALNRRLLLKRLRKELAPLDSPVMAITTIPIVADLMEALPVDRWIYYCVDDFSVWPGLEQETLRNMEQRVIARADRLIAVSETLREQLGRSREAIGLLTHGIDLEHWQREASGDIPQAFAALPTPRVTFWGLIDQRMDPGWLRALSDRMTEGTIALVGPEDDPAPELASIPRVVRPGKVAYDDLPAVAQSSEVLVMPYADLPVTRAMQPLKLLEYLATDRPVVARDLPANRPWTDCLDLAVSAEQFAELVCERLRTGLPAVQREARRRIASESWASKAERFKDLALCGITTRSGGRVS